MRVLLVNTNLRDDVYIAPPVGLCYVASAAEAAGHDITVLDPCIRRPVRRHLERALAEAAPDVVGLSVRNLDNTNLLHPVSYLPDVVEIAGIVRRLTSCPLVVGGSGASLDPEAVLRSSRADFVVVSHGERSFVRLLDALASREPAPSIPGVGWIGDDDTFHLSPPALDSFMPIHADVGRWVDMAAYGRWGGGYAIQTKRGCPHRCVYCTYGQVLEGRSVRLRDPDDVVDEIAEVLDRHRPDFFEFVDAVSNEPRDHFTAILEGILGRRLSGRFTAMGIDPRHLDEDLLDLMWRAGFRTFEISPESASEPVIRSYGKTVRREDLVRAAQAIGRTRFTVLWHFLVGGPGETNESLQESIDFVFEHLRSRRRPSCQMAMFMLGVRAYPRTPLWQLASQGRSRGTDGVRPSPAWYMSPQLDLRLAVRQLLDAAARADEVVLALDEQRLPSLRRWRNVAALLGVPKPYWRHARSMNRVVRALSLRRPDPDAVADAVHRALIAGDGWRS